MIRSAARSASVTGVPSGLPSTFIAGRLTARIAAPARTTSSVNGSISAAAASRSITCPEERASSIGGPHMLFVFPSTLLPRAGRARIRSVSNQNTRDSPWFEVVMDLQEQLMSGTSSPGPAPDTLELAALLCSRACHDLISPAGAIVNGLEVLEEEDSDEETKTFALDLIKRSAKTASARLQFCRLAFGSAGAPGGSLNLGDAQAMAQAFFQDYRTKVALDLPPAPFPKNRVQLLLNLLIIAGQTIP